MNIQFCSLCFFNVLMLFVSYLHIIMPCIQIYRFIDLFMLYFCLIFSSVFMCISILKIKFHDFWQATTNCVQILSVCKFNGKWFAAGGTQEWTFKIFLKVLELYSFGNLNFLFHYVFKNWKILIILIVHSFRTKKHFISVMKIQWKKSTIFMIFTVLPLCI